MILPTDWCGYSEIAVHAWTLRGRPETQDRGRTLCRSFGGEINRSQGNRDQRSAVVPSRGPAGDSGTSGLRIRRMLIDINTE